MTATVGPAATPQRGFGTTAGLGAAAFLGGGLAWATVLRRRPDVYAALE
ncbi:hypothetical protein [Mycolicibacterium fortuitum]|nr:hypothetical protein [Mycolicibacterium fortuitum]